MSKQCISQGCGILVVDDDEVLASSLTTLLRQRYPCVHTALSGPEAIAILSREKNICLVLVDLVMPMMDGLSVLEQVRRLRRRDRRRSRSSTTPGCRSCSASRWPMAPSLTVRRIHVSLSQQRSPSAPTRPLLREARQVQPRWV